ncbi:GGDEF domain-containing response regulator [Chthonobacter rhizosphaerae]|uniref:GGDEF domain-containing response regulator n=1 Tax=Chthonobacter rhizosphaerae TaxID=2735553 RepID=UPI0015EE5D4A|nr:diguanylate cyclase [Chthonobacter rhizosphaerae]
MHIVIVDGSRTGLMILYRMIENRGDQISLFTDGQEALDFVRENTDVEVVITSFEVATLSGTELCWEVRVLADKGRPLYVIGMSANTDSEHVIGILDAGADDFMPKPPRPDELNARLRVAERTLVMQRRLIALATMDPLCDILNRRAFFERAEEASASLPPDGVLSMILFDVDHFKRINDVYGHNAGDEVIRSIGQSRMPPDALFGRINGEEFAVVLPDVPLEGAVSVAEYLRDQIAAVTIEAGGETFTVTASFGVAVLNSGETIADTQRRADAALYHAKNSGRNRVSSFTPTPVS